MATAEPLQRWESGLSHSQKSGSCPCPSPPGNLTPSRGGGWGRDGRRDHKAEGEQRRAGLQGWVQRAPWQGRPGAGRGGMRAAEWAYLGRHVVSDAELEVLQDALHGVVGLLLGGAKVLLHGTGHGGEDSLGCLPGVHHLPRVLLLLFLQPLNVSEGLLHRHHKPGGQEGPGPHAHLPSFLSSSPPAA